MVIVTKMSAKRSVTENQRDNKKPKVVSQRETVLFDKNTIRIGNTLYKDTNAGFLLEEKPDETISETQTDPGKLDDLVRDNECNMCNEPFTTSWLFKNFLYSCCDECKKLDDYKLITKTEAKLKYLLQDCDLEKREPPLKYITQKNPHNVRWGDMKLYLELQVEKRAMEVWGNEEKIEEEKERREEKKAIATAKKFERNLKKLKMNMRSSLYDRTRGPTHTHTFSSEIYNEEEDNYTRKCISCSYEETFEKM